MKNKPVGILVVDDDRDVLGILTNILRSSGEYQVYQATNGFAALSILGSMQVDLVISDIVMPSMDGLSLMRSASARSAHTQWIFLTGAATLDRAVEAMRLGACDFFQKPLHDLNALMNAVHHALELQPDSKHSTVLHPS